MDDYVNKVSQLHLSILWATQMIAVFLPFLLLNLHYDTLSKDLVITWKYYQ